MFWICLLSFLCFTFASEVVDLDVSNFEHLTQASTGATSGDWLVKFYAPWCGHCKTLAPIWEDVANELKGVVNVAKVDVMANRALGTRFEIEGFPTLKLISKGQVYTFKGRRSKDEIIEFARGGFQISEPSVVPGQLGLFGDIMYVYNHAYKQAGKDLKRGNYFTGDVILAIMPAVFLVILLLICLIPAPEDPVARDSRVPSIPNSQSSRSQTGSTIPASSSSDSAKKSE